MDDKPSDDEIEKKWNAITLSIGQPCWERGENKFIQIAVVRLVRYFVNLAQENERNKPRTFSEKDVENGGNWLDDNIFIMVDDHDTLMENAKNQKEMDKNAEKYMQKKARQFLASLGLEPVEEAERRGYEKGIDAVEKEWEAEHKRCYGKQLSYTRREVFMKAIAAARTSPDKTKTEKNPIQKPSGLLSLEVLPGSKTARKGKI